MAGGGIEVNNLEWWNKMTKRERLDLTDRDLIVLEVVQKFRAIQSRHIAILCGFTSQSYVEKRLLKLTKFRYLNRARNLAGFPYVYSLGVNGKYELGFLGKVPKPSEGIIRHELGVAEIACYLKIAKNIDFEQMMTDRDFRLYDTKKQTKDEYSPLFESGIDHLPDLAYVDGEKLNVVEYERTLKTKERLQSNILQNDQKNCTKNQLWVVPKRRVSIWNRINAITEEFENADRNLDIIAFEAVEEEVKSFDLSKNEPIIRTWRDTKTLVDAFKGLSNEFSGVLENGWDEYFKKDQNALEEKIEGSEDMEKEPERITPEIEVPQTKQASEQPTSVKSTIPERIVIQKSSKPKPDKNPFKRFF